MTVIEENILIAEYMGVTMTPLGKYVLPRHGYLTMNQGFKTEFTAENLKYHRRWEWIMPVVTQLCTETGFNYSLDAKGFLYDIVIGDGDAKGGICTDISATKSTFNAVVEVLLKRKKKDDTIK